MIKKYLSSIYISLTGVSFLWGTSFAAAKVGLTELHPMNLVAFRFIIASAIFAVMLLLMRSANKIDYHDLPRFIILSFLAITSYFYIQFTGLTYTTTINSALIIATSPIYTAIFGVLYGLERISAKGALGITAAFLGVTTIITNGNLYGLFESSTIKGDLMLLCNAIVWAGFTLYGKNILQKYRPFVAMAYIHIFGTIMLLPFALIPSFLTPIPLQDQLPAISTNTVLATFYLAVLCSVFAYYTWYNGVDTIGAIRTAVFSYLNPLFAMIVGILFLGENITVYTLAGGILVILGVYATNTYKIQPAITTDK